MDIWEEMYNKAAALYNPSDLSPFFWAHHVVCAMQNDQDEIFTGFAIEGASGVLNLCAERVAALNMICNGHSKVIKRLIVFRDKPPYKGGTFLPCGACREFFMQLAEENADMQIITDYDSRETITLKEIFPLWWGQERYDKQK